MAATTITGPVGPIPSLTTERLLLRAYLESDAPAVAALQSDAEVMRFVGPGGRPEPSLAEAWKHIAVQLGHWMMKGYGKWAVIEKKTGLFVGRVGLFDQPYDWPGLELGWTLARASWGKGYATEAARAALKWSFDNLAAGEIISAIYPENKASIRVAKRIGERFFREGALRGKPCQIYGLSRADWELSLKAAGGPG